MRDSIVLKKLRAGEIVTCFKTNFREPRIVEMIGLYGFDCAWLDYEHCGNDLGDIEKQIYAAKAANIDVVVRVARGSYSDYIRPLEMDASGIMVPHVMSAEDGRKVVKMTKFQPIGMRPCDGGNSDGDYCKLSGLDYLAKSNREKFVICQIEDPEAMEQVEELAQIEGIDMLFFGPGDYSHAMGVFGQIDHPSVKAPWKKMAEVCKKYGKFAGTVANPDNIEELVDWGYSFLNMSSDVGALKTYLESMIKVYDKVK